MADVVIQVKDVCKTFGKAEVLKHVTAKFEAGKIYGIIGRNGSGKTVLFKCICGFVPVTSGTIRVRSQVMGKDVYIPKDMGIIIESPGFLPGYSGFHNLRFLARIRNKIDDEKIRETLRFVGLDPGDKKHVGKYSMGMRQRLGLAQAIMEDPEILILDEPMNGLDRQGVKEIRQCLLKLRDQGKTILLASHNAEDIRVLCDQVYEMDAGELFLAGEQPV